MSLHDDILSTTYSVARARTAVKPLDLGRFFASSFRWRLASVNQVTKGAVSGLKLGVRRGLEQSNRG